MLPACHFEKLEAPPGPRVWPGKRVHHPSHPPVPAVRVLLNPYGGYGSAPQTPTAKNKHSQDPSKTQWTRRRGAVDGLLVPAPVCLLIPKTATNKTPNQVAGRAVQTSMPHPPWPVCWQGLGFRLCPTSAACAEYVPATTQRSSPGPCTPSTHLVIAADRWHPPPWALTISCTRLETAGAPGTPAENQSLSVLPVLFSCALAPRLASARDVWDAKEDGPRLLRAP